MSCLLLYYDKNSVFPAYNLKQRNGEKHWKQAICYRDEITLVNNKFLWFHTREVLESSQVHSLVNLIEIGKLKEREQDDMRY